MNEAINGVHVCVCVCVRERGRENRIQSYTMSCSV